MRRERRMSYILALPFDVVSLMEIDFKSDDFNA